MVLTKLKSKLYDFTAEKIILKKLLDKAKMFPKYHLISFTVNWKPKEYSDGGFVTSEKVKLLDKIKIVTHNYKPYLAFDIYNYYDSILDSTISISNINKNNTDDVINRYPKYLAKLLKICITPLLVACREGLDNLALDIISNYGYWSMPDKTDMFGNTAFSWACVNGMEKVANMILDCFGGSNNNLLSSYNNTELLYACKNGMTKTATRLLKMVKNYNINFVQFDTTGNTCMMYAIKNNMGLIPLNIKQILGDMCYPNMINENNETAFSLACKYGHSSIANYLLDTFGHCFHPGLVDTDGVTPLIHAIKSNLESVVLKLIGIYRGECDLFAICKDGKTALDWAYHMKNDNIIKKIDVLFATKNRDKPTFIIVYGTKHVGYKIKGMEEIRFLEGKYVNKQECNKIRDLAKSILDDFHID
jgi:ankyrin repeat protein